jgi:hypothetical protein
MEVKLMFNYPAWRQQRILAEQLVAISANGCLYTAPAATAKKETSSLMIGYRFNLILTLSVLILPPSWGIVGERNLQDMPFRLSFFPDNVKGEGFLLPVLADNQLIVLPHYKPATFIFKQGEKQVIDRWIDFCWTILYLVSTGIDRKPFPPAGRMILCHF